MKYIYVLTSSINDTYYEQFLLSLTSFRLHNPHDEIIVLTDTKTKESLIGKRGKYENFASDIKIIELPKDFNQKQVSRWIKTSIRGYISGDFLFIDCDTVIAEKLPENFPADMQIGAVLDTHALLSQHHLRSDFQRRDRLAGFQSSIKGDTQFNSGVLFCRDTPKTHAFFQRWHDLWLQSNKNGVSADQPSFNQTNYEMRLVTELGGEWNCQISHNGLPFLHDAKIIHYYATSLVSFTSPYTLASPEVFASIKKTGTLSPDIQILLHNPRGAFSRQSRIIADTVVFDVINSSLFYKLLWFRKKHGHIFKRLDVVIAQLTRIIKKVSGRGGKDA